MSHAGMAKQLFYIEKLWHVGNTIIKIGCE